MSDVELAIAALRRGELVVIPTDTVYGLAANADAANAAEALYAAKGREARRPTAVLFASLGELLARVPELPERSAALARALLPGPLTLVVPNPARRFAWVTGTNPDALGVRVPDLPGATQEAIAAVGAVVATSANLSGDPDPRRLEEVPDTIRAGAAAVVDGGEVPGTPSTVVDLTGPEPTVLREGAIPAAEVEARVRSALSA